MKGVLSADAWAGRRMGSGLVFQHYPSMALAACKRDMFKYKT